MKLLRLTTILFAAMLSLSAWAEEAFKLSGQVQPIRQTIKLKLDPTDEVFSGTTTIEIEIKQPTSTIKLYSKGLSIESVDLQASSNNNTNSNANNNTNSNANNNAHRADSKQVLLVTNSNQYDTAPYDIIALKSEKVIPKGHFQLSLAFSGQYSQTAEGLFKIVQGEQNQLFTQFQPMQARRVFPAFDQPNFKIPFQFEIDAPDGYQVISNTPQKRKSTQQGRSLFIFEPTLPVYTDVLAFAVGQFDAIDIPDMPIPAKLYVSKGKSAQSEFIKQNIAKIYRQIETFFTLPYPYAKLDFLAIPDYPGAGMENVGLIVMKEDFILLGQQPAISEQKYSLKLVAHEIAHMWFGNSVTMGWWNDLWLNESFAEWLAKKVLTQSYPQLSPELDLPQLNALSDDNVDTQQAIRRTIKTVADVNSVGQLVYSKGNAILNMVEHYVGEIYFRQAVVTYLKAYKNGNAGYRDFIKHIEKASGKKLDGIFSSFLNQAGFPLVSFTIDNGNLLLSQQPFGSTNKTAKQQSWQLPLRLKILTDNAVKVQGLLLNSQTMTLELPPGTKAFFPDVGAIGYFRYDLPPAFEQVIKSSLPLLADNEKLSWLKNSQQLSKINKRAYQDVFSLELALLSDLSLNPKITSDIVKDLDFSYAEFIPAKAAKAYSQQIATTLAPRLKTMDWAAKEDLKKQALKARLLNLAGGKLADTRAIAFAKKHYQAVLKDRSGFDAAMAKAVLEVVAATSGKAEFSAFEKTYISASNQKLKSTILTAMGYFASPALVTRYYEFLLSGKVPIDDIGYRFQYPSFNPALRHHVVDYIEQNKPKILARINEQQWFPYVFYTTCEEDIRQRINKLFAGWAETVPGLDDKMATIDAIIKQCIQTRAAAYPH